MEDLADLMDHSVIDCVSGEGVFGFDELCD